MTQALTENQLREATELGDDFLVGAVGRNIFKAAKNVAQKTKASTTVELTVTFQPPLGSLAQYRELTKNVSIDGGALTSLGRSGAVIVGSLEPGDESRLRPGLQLFSLGSSRVVVTRWRKLI